MTKPVLPPTEPLQTGQLATPWRLSRLSLFGGVRRRRSRRGKAPFWPSPAGWVELIALIAAISTAHNPVLVQLLERNLQTTFFDLRGTVAPPTGTQADPTQPGIMILAMDGDTMTQGTQIYPTDPQQYPYFEPIQQWPWQRTAYAIAIDRLMQAGARAVVLDVVLDANSSYGDADDEQLRRVLAKYRGRVTLAAKYVEEERRTGVELQLLTPNPLLESAQPNLGFINIPLSANGRMHELGKVYQQALQASYQDLGVTVPQLPALAEAALQSAGIAYPPPAGPGIFFYGPSRTFEHVPFWHVLDPQNWNDYHLKNQTFKNQIVLIGPTGGGESFQDFHASPFSGTLRHPEKMAGVEIQANAIATLMQNRAIAPAFSNPLLQGVFVAGLVLLVGYVQGRTRHDLNPSRLLRRFSYGTLTALGYGIFSYSVFVYGRFILPTAIPMLAIVASSATTLVTGMIGYQISVRKDAKRMSGSSTLQSEAGEFENPDVKEVLEQSQREFIGTILDGRYQVQDQIAIGGFGETYKAIDTKRPGSPVCVVKRLRLVNKSPKVIRLAKKLFNQEAVVLEALGTHDQIPQLLAYFEERDDFYLIQQYIDGISLSDELRLPKLLRPLSEQAVVVILHELLQILDFVHQQGVIHRDIKPANIIRRQSDRKLVLIDFGAVKQIHDLHLQEDGTILTVPIGTQGYTAPEQAQGKPCPASDIYSLGMTGIRALTGIEPKNLDTNQNRAAQGVHWQDSVQASDALIQILEKMTCFDVRDRYQTVPDVMTALKPLIEFAHKSGYTPEFIDLPATTGDDPSTADETKRWLPPQLPPIDLPSTNSDPAYPDHPTPSETLPWGDCPASLPSTTADSAARDAGNA